MLLVVVVLDAMMLLSAVMVIAWLLLGAVELCVTMLLVAHRLATVRDSDAIAVMRDGKVHEVGTHESLLEGGGFYASLIRRQVELRDERARNAAIAVESVSVDEVVA